MKPAAKSAAKAVKPAVLTRYRVMAYITGCALICLCLCMVAKYGFGTGTKLTMYVAMVHGYAYIVYLLFAFDLSLKMKWSWPRMIAMLLAGTIPVCSFIAERKAVAAYRAHTAPAAEPVPAAA